MKKITLLFTAIACVFLAACASEPQITGDPNKYLFSDLEEVDSIQNWKLDGWNVVDNQSVIVYTSPATSYLLILMRPDHNLNFAEALLISSTAGRVMARFDTVTTARDRVLKTPIERIYKLKGKEQIAAVRKQIKGE